MYGYNFFYKPLADEKMADIEQGPFWSREAIQKSKFLRFTTVLGTCGNGTYCQQWYVVVMKRVKEKAVN